MRKLLIAVVVLAVLVAGLYVVAARLLGSGLMRATLEQQLSARLGQPVRIGAASAAIFPRLAIDLRDVSVGEPAGLSIGRIRLVTGLRPLLSRIVQDAEIILEDGEVRLPLPFDLFPATPGSAVPQSGSPLTVASIRTIELRRVALVAGDQRWLADADSTVVGDRLDVTRLSIQAKSTRLNGSGALTSMSRTEGQFTVTGDPLDLDELIAFGSAVARPSASSSGSAAAPSPLRIELTVTAPTGSFAAHQFRELSTTTVITNGALSLSPLAVAALGGRFNGRLDADTRKAVPLLRLNGRVEGLDVPEVMRAAGSDGRGITGTLGGQVTLAAVGTDSDTLLRTARGSVVAAMTNGTLPRLELVRPIVLAFGKPSGAPPEGSGSMFSRLGGTFALANGVVYSNDVALTSRDFDMNGAATVTLASGALAGRGDVRLSSELSAQAGVDLRRYAQEDGRVVVPATIGGTLQQPTVSLDLVAATRRALGNELQRRAKSLFDDLFKRRKQ